MIKPKAPPRVTWKMVACYLASRRISSIDAIVDIDRLAHGHIQHVSSIISLDSRCRDLVHICFVAGLSFGLLTIEFLGTDNQA